MAAVQTSVGTAESRWLRTWTTGPTEPGGHGLPTGAVAPDLELLDDRGATRHLAEFWTDGPALLLFWRHFGCGCGVDRAARLRREWAAYRSVGLTPVIIGQGEPERAAAYRAAHDLPCPVLCDPEHAVYRAYGIGQWPVERVLFDAPPELWGHGHDVGRRFQDERRLLGRPLVDDPWRAVAEFVVSAAGTVRLCYSYQHCADYPDPRVLTTAAQLSRPMTS